jgi:hypothetical protein
MSLSSDDASALFSAIGALGTLITMLVAQDKRVKIGAGILFFFCLVVLGSWGIPRLLSMFQTIEVPPTVTPYVPPTNHIVEPTMTTQPDPTEYYFPTPNEPLGDCRWRLYGYSEEDSCLSRKEFSQAGFILQGQDLYLDVYKPDGSLPIANYIYRSIPANSKISVTWQVSELTSPSIGNMVFAVVPGAPSNNPLVEVSDGVRILLQWVGDDSSYLKVCRVGNCGSSEQRLIEGATFIPDNQYTYTIELTLDNDRLTIRYCRYPPLLDCETAFENLENSDEYSFWFGYEFQHGYGSARGEVIHLSITDAD